MLRDIVISDYPIVKSLVYPRPLVLAGPAGVGRRALVQGLKAEFPSAFVAKEAHTCMHACTHGHVRFDFWLFCWG